MDESPSTSPIESIESPSFESSLRPVYTLRLPSGPYSFDVVGAGRHPNAAGSNTCIDALSAAPITASSHIPHLVFMASLTKRGVHRPGLRRHFPKKSADIVKAALKAPASAAKIATKGRSWTPQPVLEPFGSLITKEA